MTFRPSEIECLPTGWSHESASCDATNGGLTPGAQMALIIVGLLLLCGATFLWQRYRKKDPNSKFSTKCYGSENFQYLNSTLEHFMLLGHFVKLIIFKNRIKI